MMKKQRIGSYLQQLNSDIAFLQETHLKNDYVSYLKKGWVGQVYHSQFNAKARGTATLIHKDIPFLAKEMMLIRMGDLSLYRANYLPVLSSRSMSTPQIMMIVISLTSYFPPYLATTITI